MGKVGKTAAESVHNVDTVVSYRSIDGAKFWVRVCSFAVGEIGD